MRPLLLCVVLLLTASLCAQLPSNSSSPDTRESIQAEVARLTREGVLELEKLAVKGHPRAMMVLSAALRQGRVAASDPFRSLELLMQSAKAGYAPAQNELGSYYMIGNHVEKNARTAREWFERSSMQGYPDADFNLGLLAGRGEDGPADWPLAIRHFRVAANNGHAMAAYILGVTLRDGKNVTAEEKEGIKWLKVAAHRGEPKAQLELGVAHFNGQGVAKDAHAALTLFLKAADQGLPEAQLNAALLYHRGESGLIDMERAVFWYRRAASGRNAIAMRVLGALYADGAKVKQNKVAAAAYFLSATDAGDSAAAGMLSDLKKEMTPEQYAEALAMSRDYLAKIGIPKSDVVATK